MKQTTFFYAIGSFIGLFFFGLVMCDPVVSQGVIGFFVACSIVFFVSSKRNDFFVGSKRFFMKRPWLVLFLPLIFIMLGVVLAVFLYSPLEKLYINYLY